MAKRVVLSAKGKKVDMDALKRSSPMAIPVGRKMKPKASTTKSISVATPVTPKINAEKQVTVHLETDVPSVVNDYQDMEDMIEFAEGVGDIFISLDEPYDSDSDTDERSPKKHPNHKKGK